MYLKFIERLKEGDITQDDWRAIEPRLGRVLGVMPTREGLDKVMEYFPEARQKIEADIEGFVRDAMRGPSGVLMEYLKEEKLLSEGFDLWAHAKEHSFSPLQSAIINGNIAVVRDMVASITDEIVDQFTRKTEKKTGFSDRFIWHLGFDGESSKEALQALEMILDATPERYRPRLICHSHYYMLEGPFVHGDTRLANKMIDMMPMGALRNFAQSSALSMFLTHNRNGDYSEIIEHLAEKLGKDEFAEAITFQQRGLYKKRRYKVEEVPDGCRYYGTTIGSMMYWMRSVDNQHNIEAAFKNIPQAVASDILHDDNFRPMREAFYLDLPAQFRVYYNTMTPESREELFKNEQFLNTVKVIAALGWDEPYKTLQDLLPPEIMGFLDKRPIPPADLLAKKPQIEKVRDKAADLPPLWHNLKYLPQHPALNQPLREHIEPILATAVRMEDSAQHPEIAAAKLAILFENYTQVNRYLNRFSRGYGGEPPKQVVHDAVLFEIPKEGEWNIPHWRRAVLDFGPPVSKFLALAPKIEALAKAEGKPLPYKPAEVLEFAYRIAYERQAEHPEFAKLCLSLGCDEDQFNRSLDILQGNPISRTVYDKKSEDTIQIAVKSNDRLPPLFIDGSEVGFPAYYMAKLEMSNPDDVKTAMVLGELSHCCQSVAKAGEKYTLSGITSQNSGFYVWKKKFSDKEDLIVGQSWAWIGKENGICFDSIEPLGSAHNKIFAAFMDRFEERSTQEYGFKRVTAGMGGKTPKEFKERYPKATKAEVPLDWTYNARTNEAEHDSKQQYWITRTQQPVKPASTTPLK